jgi:hypothetical protein
MKDYQFEQRNAGNTYDQVVIDSEEPDIDAVSDDVDPTSSFNLADKFIEGIESVKKTFGNLKNRLAEIPRPLSPKGKRVALGAVVLIGGGSASEHRIVDAFAQGTDPSALSSAEALAKDQECSDQRLAPPTVEITSNKTPTHPKITRIFIKLTLAPVTPDCAENGGNGEVTAYVGAQAKVSGKPRAYTIDPRTGKKTYYKKGQYVSLIQTNSMNLPVPVGPISDATPREPILLGPFKLLKDTKYNKHLVANPDGSLICADGPRVKSTLTGVTLVGESADGGLEKDHAGRKLMGHSVNRVLGQGALPKEQDC